MVRYQILFFHEKRQWKWSFYVLGIDSLNNVIINQEKIESSEPCWDGYQVIQSNFLFFTYSMFFISFSESVILSIEFNRHGFSWNDVKMGRSISWNGSIDKFIIRWRTYSSWTTCPSRKSIRKFFLLKIIQA